MVDKFVKAERMQRLKKLGIREIGKQPEPLAGSRTAEYFVSYACFSCRVSFKKAQAESKLHTCPNCRNALAEMGRSFKAPRKTATKQWSKVQRLWEAGYRFPTNTTRSAARYPEHLSDVDEFIRANPRHPFRLKQFWPDVSL